jgi:alpha-mannosidase
MVKQTKGDLQRDTEALKERIDKIIDHFTVNDVPILRLILNLTDSRDDLKKLSKALDRLADLAEHYTSLTKKLAVIEQAEVDPNWFALAFGDFEQDVDSALNDMFTND